MKFEPCLDPNCKGCQWMLKNQKAIESRMKENEKKSQKMK
jgi:hypothetical protein